MAPSDNCGSFGQLRRMHDTGLDERLVILCSVKTGMIVVSAKTIFHDLWETSSAYLRAGPNSVRYTRAGFNFL
jgi:hypothetical protein